ncbi:MAG: hypothetical protein JWQ40_1813 [Segetibacter sp.]|nr:hypothetical protein [Segetibacter sp.]
MDYIKTYKSFINSHYLSEGVRITTGVLLPAFLMNYFSLLSTGIVISLGALFVSITDSPGPIHHRRNGMLACIAAIFLVTLSAGFIAGSPVLLTLFLAVACFFFSMIGIYGARPTSIGTAAMIVLTLSFDPQLNLVTPLQVVQHSLYMVSGGLWYMCFSTLLYNFRPYRLAQQALGDCIQATAQYMLIRAEFYKKQVDYESTYKQVLQQQAVVQHKQNELSELLFKTRSIVKESTNVGRTLVMIYMDVADIFERIMMSHQQYSLLHAYFDETDILDDYYTIARELGNELYEVGIAVQSGEQSTSNGILLEHIHKTREKLDNLRLSYLKPDNIEGFISLRRILENIADLGERLNILHKYTTYDKSIKQKQIKEAGYEKLISSQQITPGLFIDNFTLKSDTFRHSLRVSIAIVVGYLVTQLFNIGHSYWVLLTIIVILKPAYSLTKQRNADRLLGTFAGIFIGIIILYFIKNETVLLVLLILFMAGAYTFMRTNYFIMVFLMTPYLILFYHLLNPTNFTILLKDRVVDTIIGSVIAFAASFFLFPAWEREKIKPLMVTMLAEVKGYFTLIANAFNGQMITRSEQQVGRRNALVALANLSDAFNRMLSEPKSQQKETETLHQFVVLNHMLTSYIATLSHYLQMKTIPYTSEEFVKVAEDIQKYFTNAIGILEGSDNLDTLISYKDSLRHLNERANNLLQKRKQELKDGLMESATRQSLFDLKSIVDQFNLIYNVAVDINKVSQSLAPTLN